MLVSEGIFIIMIVPLIIFVGLVAPIWLLLHYRSKQQLNQGLTEKDYQQLQQLADTADKMAQRIDTLEKILDSEAPNWRAKLWISSESCLGYQVKEE